MNANKMRKMQNIIRVLFSVVFFWLYIPHIICYLLMPEKKKLIKRDISTALETFNIELTDSLALLFFLHNDRYFRKLFYHRIGPVISLLIGWYRPGDRYFVISKTTKIGGGAYFAHPFSTEINAKSIGDNFKCRHLTTIGNKKDGDNDNRPIIGDNVTLGVNVTIIGPVHIGDNVIIGAGSVVVKDIPSDCVVAGNPAKILKQMK